MSLSALASHGASFYSKTGSYTPALRHAKDIFFSSCCWQKMAFCQATSSKRVNAFLAFSGKGSLETQIFVPSRKVVLYSNGVFHAEEPCNTFSVQLNESETLDIKTPLIPINLPECELNELIKMSETQKKIDVERDALFRTRDRWGDGWTGVVFGKGERFPPPLVFLQLRYSNKPRK